MGRQVCGNRNIKGYIEITSGITSSKIGYTLASETDRLTILCTRLYLVDNLAIDGFNQDLSTEYSLRISDIHRREEIIVSSLKLVRRRYANGYKEISSGAAILTRFTLFTDTNGLSVIDTAGNGNGNLLALCNISASVTTSMWNWMAVRPSS